MNVRERLERLPDLAGSDVDRDLARHAGAEVFARAGRRRLRRRAGAVASVVVVVAVAFVAWPDLSPGGLVIDEVAGDPDAPATSELDLPDGWQRLEVGGAAFGVPGDLEVRRLPFGQEDEPCPEAYTARVVVTEAPDAITCTPPGGPGLIAGPLEHPDYGVIIDWADHETRWLSTAAGRVLMREFDRTDQIRRRYEFEEANLVLTFAHVELAPGFDEQVVATVRALDDTTDGEVDTPSGPDDSEARMDQDSGNEARENPSAPTGTDENVDAPRPSGPDEDGTEVESADALVTALVRSEWVLEGIFGPAAHGPGDPGTRVTFVAHADGTSGTVTAHGDCLLLDGRFEAVDAGSIRLIEVADLEAPACLGQGDGHVRSRFSTGRVLDVGVWEGGVLLTGDDLMGIVLTAATP